MLFRFTLDTKAAPDEVFRAFTDFSDRRLTVWKRTLDPKKYELRELGDTWAVAKEGSAGTSVWVVLRYDWKEPGRVHWSLVDSNFCDGGTGDITITPGVDGGSRVAVEIDHTSARGLRGTAVLLMQRLVGPVMFPRLWRSALDRLPAEEEQEG